MANKFKITNNILAMAVVIAIVISAGGTWIALNQFTGRATSGTGYSNVTILSNNAISLVAGTAAVDWGGGYVWANETYTAVLWSINATTSGGSWSAPANPTINVTNDGNLMLNISFTSSNDYTDLFNNGTAWLKYQTECDGAESAVGGDCCNASQYNDSWRNISTGNNIVCNSTYFVNDKDEIGIWIGMGVPQSEDPGDFNVTLTINSASL